MEDSILTSTKKILGVSEDFTDFDLDIITHINSAISVLNQIGVTPNDLIIEDDTANWSDITLPIEQLGLVKTYIYLNARMLFDPPTTSFHLDAMQKQLDEHLSRLSYMREGMVYGLVGDLVVIGESAAGVQLTPAYVWIMDHNLHFYPAAMQFFELDTDEELEPESTQQVNVNRILATWPTPTAGRWRVS